MKKTFGLYTIIIILMVLACKKTTYEPLDFNGNIKIKITTYDEFRNEINDKENVELLIEGLEGENLFSSDTGGNIVVYDLPMSVYNFHFSKEKYGEYLIQFYKFIGDTSDITWDVPLHKKSTIKILDYQAYTKNDSLFVTGTISHNYSQEYLSEQYYPYYFPSVCIFMSESPMVSHKNYTYINYSPCLKNESEKFNLGKRLPNNLFPSGSTIYIVLYGKEYGSYYLIYDYVNDISYYTHLGEPSEIKSIVIP